MVLLCVHTCGRGGHRCVTMPLFVQGWSRTKRSSLCTFIWFECCLECVCTQAKQQSGFIIATGGAYSSITESRGRRASAKHFFALKYLFFYLILFLSPTPTKSSRPLCWKRFQEVNQTVRKVIREPQDSLRGISVITQQHNNVTHSKSRKLLS